MTVLLLVAPFVRGDNDGDDWALLGRLVPPTTRPLSRRFEAVVVDRVLERSEQVAFNSQRLIVRDNGNALWLVTLNDPAAAPGLLKGQAVIIVAVLYEGDPKGIPMKRAWYRYLFVKEGMLLIGGMVSFNGAEM